MYPHRIRLRGPWECVTADGETRRVTVPCQLSDLGLSGYSGELQLIRKFGYPGQIDSFERVWLICADIMGKARFTLNGEACDVVGRAGNHEFDVTSLLRPHNRLEITLLADSEECGLGEVALEVRCAVSLTNMRLKRDGGSRTVLTADIVGNWPEPFDLYILVDGVEAFYTSITADGKNTTLRADLDSGLDQTVQRQTVRVDLVQGPSLWFRQELPLNDRA